MKSRKINSLIAETLCHGGIGVMPTDTIYGIVGSALNKKTVSHIYTLRKRNPKKPMIILIGSMADMKSFGIRLTPAMKKILKNVWPGAVSVVLPIGVQAAKKFAHLHRGTKTLAFRLPKPVWLRTLLKETGPLVAPSANFEGKRPAQTVQAAKHYFGDTVQFYVDAGRCVSKPSTLIAIKNGAMVVLRKGVVPIRLL
jgi:L-threonylcarbamoyladenylate synthase